MCSVACGKGVQQRFRRCLLDNPMMTLNYNYNVLNGDEYMEESMAEAEADTETVPEVEADFDNNAFDMDYELVTEMDAVLINGQGSHGDDDDISQRIITRPENPTMSQSPRQSNVAFTDNDIGQSHRTFKDNGEARVNKDFNRKDSTTTRNPFADNNGFTSKNSASRKSRILSGEGFHQQVELKSRTATNEVPVMDQAELDDEDTRGPMRRRDRGRRRPRHHHRLTKAYSTLFCEGYNVEQRNCNVFECSGKFFFSTPR